jgi:uridine kinase
MNLQENIQRIIEMMGLLTEENQEKEIILIDGTSSAGKSQTAKILKTVPFYESTYPNQWVQIDSDMFVGSDGEERRLKLDHPNIRQWAKETGEAGIVSGLYRKDGVDLPENPYEDEYIEGTDPRNWYMAQEVKVGGHNKIIIDDIGNGILQYLPNENIKNVLLHAPIYIILKNVGERNKREKKNNTTDDVRNPEEVLNQYLKKYEATNQKPSIEIGDPTTELTKDGLIGLLKSNGLDDEYINNFLNELGVDGDGVYYIKVKDSYMTPTTKLINVDAERTVYLDQFKDLIK